MGWPKTGWKGPTTMRPRGAKEGRRPRRRRVSGAKWPRADEGESEGWQGRCQPLPSNEEPSGDEAASSLDLAVSGDTAIAESAEQGRTGWAGKPSHELRPSLSFPATTPEPKQEPRLSQSLLRAPRVAPIWGGIAARQPSAQGALAGLG